MCFYIFILQSTYTPTSTKYKLLCTCCSFHGIIKIFTFTFYSFSLEFSYFYVAEFSCMPSLWFLALGSFLCVCVYVSMFMSVDNCVSCSHFCVTLSHSLSPSLCHLPSVPHPFLCLSCVAVSSALPVFPDSSLCVSSFVSLLLYPHFCVELMCSCTSCFLFYFPA